MSTLTGITCVLASLTFTRAPVPPPPEPDPMARGYIGITVQTGGLMIDRVEPKMPGEKAGLQAGDVIVRVGTLEPREFSQVVSHVCAFRPGAIVEIEVQRGKTRKTFKLKLTTRPPELDAPPVPLPIDIDD